MARSPHEIKAAMDDAGPGGVVQVDPEELQGLAGAAEKPAKKMPDVAEVEVCQSCKYWRRNGDTKLGECRFNPPTIQVFDKITIPVDGGGTVTRPLYATLSPERGEMAWCGKWTPQRGAVDFSRLGPTGGNA